MRLFQIEKKTQLGKNLSIWKRQSCVNVFICINFILYSSIYYRLTRKTEPHDSQISSRPNIEKEKERERKKKTPQTLSININITNDTHTKTTVSLRIIHLVHHYLARNILIKHTLHVKEYFEKINRKKNLNWIEERKKWKE